MYVFLLLQIQRFQEQQRISQIMFCESEYVLNRLCEHERVWQIVIDGYRRRLWHITGWSCAATFCQALVLQAWPGCEAFNQRNIFTIFIFPWSIYGPVMSLEQRHNYQKDFCSEYDEYKDLHSRIATITHMFVQLGSKIKSLSPGTPEHKVHWILVNPNVSFLTV